MSETVTVSIPHRLGKEEAFQRLKSGFSRMRDRLVGLVTIEQETREGDTVQFRVRGLGQSASGWIVAQDDCVLLEIALPWLLARIAARFLPALRNETAKLLGPR